MAVRPAKELRSEVSVPVAIVGGGACGLVAALAAQDAGVQPLILERDAVPSGSTALSSGLIPAPGTRFQREFGVEDDPACFVADIMHKNDNGSDPAVTRRAAEEIGPTLEWLADNHGLPFELVTGFLYPGHSRMRMHALPSRNGRELIDRLATAVTEREIDLITEAHVVALFADSNGRVTGLTIRRPDGSRDNIGCDALVLACNGYGGNQDLVRRHIPQMADALYFGHPGNTGDAILWGQRLGAQLDDLSAYQGHGSVAHPQGILVTWALMMEGAFQVNLRGERFSNEHDGYSEQAERVLAQPEGTVWNIYDSRLHELGKQFDDYRQAIALGAIRRADDAESLIRQTQLPAETLARTIAEARELSLAGKTDNFGRTFTVETDLVPPYYAVRVTGALFHTQGGLAIDEEARVLRRAGGPLPNLFAAGGAARGVSGATVGGYLSGNGLLTAIGLGRIAGQSAATLRPVGARAGASEG